MNASKAFAEHFSLYYLAHLPFFRPCSADAIMSVRTHTHTVKISALIWLWLATLPACGLLDLRLCCHHLIAVLVQHGGMLMWFRNAKYVCLRNAKYVWNIFFFKHLTDLNRMMTCFQCCPKLSSNLSMANFATTVVE